MKSSHMKYLYVVVGELTVPWEDNIDERHEFKRAKYLDLVHECEARGWTVFVSHLKYRV